jgi:hypothetical protein
VTRIVGVHLLPASGEFAYDTLPFSGAQRVTAGLGLYKPMNTFLAPGGTKTDYSYAVDQLQSEHPECETVSLVCAWFFNSEDASVCQIYPSTNYLLGGFEQIVSGVPVTDHWRVSGLTEQNYPGVIPLPALPGTTNFVYGGTPSDPSIVRCIQDLKSRGLRVTFTRSCSARPTASPGAGASPIRATSRARRPRPSTPSSARRARLSSPAIRSI